MNDPLNEVEGVIRGLTQTPPSEQRRYIETYFTPDASFVHPFCRTGNWPNSRFLIRAIYRWYKIMSPHIDLAVHSIGLQPCIFYIHHWTDRVHQLTTRRI